MKASRILAAAWLSALLLATPHAHADESDAAVLRRKLAPAIVCLNREDLPLEDATPVYHAVVAQLARDPEAAVPFFTFLDRPFGSAEAAINQCAAGLDEMTKAAPQLADLDAAAGAYAAALRALVPLLREAEPYYTQRDYKDDAFARGRQIDARLSPLLARLAAASVRFRSLAERAEMRLREAELAGIEASEGRSLAFDTVAAMVAARDAVNRIQEAQRDHALSGALVAQAAAPLQSLLDEGTSRAEARPDEAAAFPLWSFTHDRLETLIAGMKQLRRTAAANARAEYVDRDARYVRDLFNQAADLYYLRSQTALLSSETDRRLKAPLVSPFILAAGVAPAGGAVLFNRPLATAPAPTAAAPMMAAPPDAASQATAAPRPDGQPAGRRVALVVGNGGYRAVPRLANPRNDANLVAAALAQRGFTLIGGGALLDLDKPGFDQAVRRFGEGLEGADVGLFYYAGHGVQIGGQNYLVPTDANPTGERDVDFMLLNVQVVLRQLESAHTRLSLVLLDACRNNPFGGRGLREAGGGLAEMRAPAGTLISYATQPGNVAQDGAVDSPYTTALIRAMQERGLGLFDLFNEVGLLVKDATDGEQQPWLAASPIQGRFYFTTP